MSPSVFVVVGSQGEYSDYREWAVCAYLDEQRARHEAERMSAELRALWQQGEQSGAVWSDEMRDKLEAFDPGLYDSWIYKPYDYRVWPVELR